MKNIIKKALKGLGYQVNRYQEEKIIKILTHFEINKSHSFIDGSDSKDEFIKHHEMMYDKMKKSSNGMVSVKDMQMMMDKMMK